MSNSYRLDVPSSPKNKVPLLERPMKTEQQLENDAKRRRASGKANRQIWKERVDDLKKVPCLDCGLILHTEVMQFDHVPERGPKLFSISRSSGKNWDMILAEIAKCDLVCANCHVMRTISRRSLS
jgi:hypothetical protein